MCASFESEKASCVCVHTRSVVVSDHGFCLNIETLIISSIESRVRVGTYEIEWIERMNKKRILWSRIIHSWEWDVAVCECVCVCGLNLFSVVFFEMLFSWLGDLDINRVIMFWVWFELSLCWFTSMRDCSCMHYELSLMRSFIRFVVKLWVSVVFMLL